MPSKEEDFKQRLAAVVSDLKDNGVDDGEAMFMLGSIATRLCDGAKKRSWSAFKPALPEKEYEQLLREFRTEGAKMHAGGKQKIAYAMQALAVSLLAHTQPDPVIREGEKLLDGYIDLAVANYRRRVKPKQPLHS